MTKSLPCRHLTTDETNLVADIVRDAGPAEVLRLIGGLVANQIEDLDAATKLRSEIFRIARQL